jgi:cytoskeleton protein RodZ
MPEADGPPVTTTRTVGERLRAAREAMGLSLAEVASRTRVPLRHLEAIEASDFAGLPSVTYAVGFVRSYARAVDEDEVALAHDTRQEVSRTARTTPVYQPYEIADPTRVPSRGLAIIAAGVALALLVLGVLWFTISMFGGGGETTAAPAVATNVPAPVPSARPSPVGGGQVRLTANDEVWMRVYDAANETLYIGTMKAGDTFDVPPAANNPMINVGRPDKLTVTLNGSTMAPLGTGERAIKDVPVGAAALAARASGQPAPATSPSASSSVPAAFAPRAQRPQARSPRRSAESLVVPSTDGETARANRRSPTPEPAAAD